MIGLELMAGHLQLMAKESKGALRVQLIGRVAPEQLDDAVRFVTGYICEMPAVLSLLIETLGSVEAPLPLQRFLALLVAYVNNPVDLLPERDYGFYGFLDDAYAVHRSLERLSHTAAEMRGAPLVAGEWRKVNEQARACLPPDVADEVDAFVRRLHDAVAQARQACPRDLERVFDVWPPGRAQRELEIWKESGVGLSGGGIAIDPGPLWLN